jgi:hypothetical protein
MKRLIFLLLLSGVCFGQSVVPFKTASNGLMLVEVEIDSHKATMLFDTGAASSYVNITSRQTMHQSKGPGFTVDGEIVVVSADVKVGKRLLSDFHIASANLDEMSKRIGIQIDGIVGQTILRQFSHVTVNYNNKTITFE